MLGLCFGILTSEFRDFLLNLTLVTLGAGKDLNHRLFFIFCFNWSDQDSKAEEARKINEEAPRSAEAEDDATKDTEGASQAGEAEEIDGAASGEAEGSADKTGDEQADEDNEEEKPAEDGSSEEKPTEEGAEGTEGQSGDTAAEADGELDVGHQTAEEQQDANGETTR